MPDIPRDRARVQRAGERAQLLTPGFSTADAEPPSVTVRDGSVLLEFVDWQTRPVRVRFAEVAGVRWEEREPSGPEERDDAVYEIVGSSWLREHLAAGAHTAADGLHHYRLCFDGLGVLDVLAGAMEPAELGEARSPGPPPAITPEALAPLGRALLDYQRGDAGALLLVHTDAADAEPLPAAHFFRADEGLDDVDRAALAAARGSVLDVGAGAGALALPLQRARHRVTALELLPELVEVLRARGLADVRLGDVASFATHERWDTVLLLMNGTALAGTLGRLPALLTRLHDLVAEGGQVLLDSTDLDGEAAVIHYQLEYRGEKGAPFPQLFVPFDRLAAEAAGVAWRAERLLEVSEGPYLARLTRG